MSGPVAVANDGGVRIIRMDRPEKNNALAPAMYLEMIRALAEADAADLLQSDEARSAFQAFFARKK